jgi:hypothetical protein
MNGMFMIYEQVLVYIRWKKASFPTRAYVSNGGFHVGEDVRLGGTRSPVIVVLLD